MNPGSLKRKSLVWLACLLSLAILTVWAPEAEAMKRSEWNRFICNQGGGIYTPGEGGTWGCAYPDWWIYCDAADQCITGGNVP